MLFPCAICIHSIFITFYILVYRQKFCLVEPAKEFPMWDHFISKMLTHDNLLANMIK